MHDTIKILKLFTSTKRIVEAMDHASYLLMQVFPSIANIKGNEITFENGKSKQYDAIIFATGYRSTVLDWLKVIEY